MWRRIKNTAAAVNMRCNDGGGIGTVLSSKTTVSAAAEIRDDCGGGGDVGR